MQQEQPGGVPGLHRNAAAWYAERGVADDAIRHAVAAGEMIWAARLIEQHYDEMFYLHGEGATVHRWLSALPGDLVRSRPRLLLTQAFLALISGRLEAVEPLLDAVQQAYARTVEEPLEPTVGRARSLLVNVPALIAIHRDFLAQLRGDADATVAFASRAMAEADEGEWQLSSTARGFLAVGEWLRGQLAQAECAFMSSIAEWRAAGLPTVTAWVLYLLGQVQRAQGALDASARTGRQALEMTAVPGRPPPPAAGPAYVILAEVAYQRNELDTALRHVTEGITLCRQFAYTPPLATGLVTLAWIRQASGDPGGALAAIAEARQASPGPAGLTGPGGPAQSGPGAAGPAAAGPGRPRRRRPLGAAARPQPGRRAELRPRTGAPGAGARPAGPGPARQPHPGQARHGQSHRGRHPRTRAQPDPLTRSDAAGRSQLGRRAHQCRSEKIL